jgi:hypothetical protein
MGLIAVFTTGHSVSERKFLVNFLLANSRIHLLVTFWRRAKLQSEIPADPLRPGHPNSLAITALPNGATVSTEEK